MAPINPDIAIRISTDVIGYYLIPKFVVTQLVKRAALRDLEKAITKKCGSSDNISTDERARLQQQFKDELTLPGEKFKFLGKERNIKWLDWWRPTMFGKKIPTPFFDVNFQRSWLRSWGGGADGILGLSWALGLNGISNKLGEENKIFAPAITFWGIGWGLSTAYAMAPWIPGLRNLKFVQNGVYNTALGVVTARDNIKCLKDPPEGGTPATEGVTSAADGAVPAPAGEPVPVPTADGSEMVMLDPSWAPFIQAYLPEMLAENPLLAATLGTNSFLATEAPFYQQVIVPDGLGGYIDPIRKMSFANPPGWQESLLSFASEQEPFFVGAATPVSDPAAPMTPEAIVDTAQTYVGIPLEKGNLSAQVLSLYGKGHTAGAPNSISVPGKLPSPMVVPMATPLPAPVMTLPKINVSVPVRIPMVVKAR